MKAEKKSFATSSRYVKSMLTNCQKYLLHGRRGSLVISEDFTGVKAYGSQALLRVFNKYRAEFEAAAREDTKILDDGNNSLDKTALPVICKGGITDVFSALYASNEVPRLPFHLEVCNQRELVNFISKLIRVDIVEQGGKPVSMICWGKAHSKPSFWPEDIAPWRLCRSPIHGQVEDFGMPFAEVMREAARRALTAKGLDWREHYDQTCDRQVERRRLRHRGISLPDSGQGEVKLEP